MRAEYDSKADALSIDLLSPAGHLGLLRVAAERHGLDAQALEAAARSALTALDRTVVLDVLASA